MEIKIVWDCKQILRWALTYEGLSLKVEDVKSWYVKKDICVSKIKMYLSD